MPYVKLFFNLRRKHARTLAEERQRRKYPIQPVIWLRRRNYSFTCSHWERPNGYPENEKNRSVFR